MFNYALEDIKLIVRVIAQMLIHFEYLHKNWKICMSLTLLQNDISEPVFYGDLVDKFKRIVGKPYFSIQLKR